MEIRKGKDKRAVTIIAQSKGREECTHHSQRRELLLAVIFVMNGVWLMGNAVIVTTQKIEQVRLRG